MQTCTEVLLLPAGLHSGETHQLMLYCSMDSRAHHRPRRFIQRSFLGVCLHTGIVGLLGLPGYVSTKTMSRATYVLLDGVTNAWAAP